MTSALQRKAEALQSSSRKRHARRLSGLHVCDKPTLGAQVQSIFCEDPKDVASLIRARWPDLWSRVSRLGEIAEENPFPMLIRAIETGLEAMEAQA